MKLDILVVCHLWKLVLFSTLKTNLQPGNCCLISTPMHSESTMATTMMYSFWNHFINIIGLFTLVNCCANFSSFIMYRNGIEYNKNIMISKNAKNVSSKFQGCFTKVSRVFQESFNGVSEKLYGCYMKL